MDPTEVGRIIADAAEEVARVLQPHFRREEDVALLPLGLLQTLAVGDSIAGITNVLALTDTLKAELPRMLEEHVAIREALEHLLEVATAENQPEYVQLAEEIMLHARMEEQVTYPAAILVGEYVRPMMMRESRDAPKPSGMMEMQARMMSDSVIHHRVWADSAMHRMMMQMMQAMSPEQREQMMQRMHGRVRRALGTIVTGRRNKSNREATFTGRIRTAERVSRL